MKKTKKALASLAIAGMTLSMVPFNVFAASTIPTRIAGTTAAQTAAAIADYTGYTGTAILASSESYGMVDALTAGPLAASLKAPILLTGAGSSLDAATKAELTKLAVKKVYVTSGTAVIKQSVIDEVKAMGIEVVALGGYDRAETSVNIAKQMTGVTKVAVANGIPDALSIASVAAAANEPILLTDKDALPSSVASYLAGAGVTSADVIGGTGIISDAVKAALPSATRHAGMTAYDTNNQVIQDFASSLQFDNIYVANGVTGIDALAGAPLAAQTKSAIVLTDGKTVPAVAAFTHGKNASAVVTALGGEYVVPETVRAGVAAGQVTPVSNELKITSVTSLDDTNRFLKMEFSKPVSGLEAANVSIKNAKSGDAYGVKAVSLSADGMTAQLELFAADDGYTILKEATEYIITVNVNGMVLQTTFIRSAHLDEDDNARVTKIDPEGHKFTVSYNDAKDNNKLKTKQLDVPSTINFDYMQALGDVVRVWYDGKDNLIKYEIYTKKVVYEAFQFDKKDRIKTLDEEVKYDLADDCVVILNEGSSGSGSKAEVTATSSSAIATTFFDGMKDRKYKYGKIIFNDSNEVERIYAYDASDKPILVKEVDGNYIYGYGTGKNELDLKDYRIVDPTGKQVKISDIKPGSVVFFNSDAYAGDGVAIVAPAIVKGEIDNVYEDSFDLAGKEYDYTQGDTNPAAYAPSHKVQYVDEDGSFEDLDKSAAEQLQAGGQVEAYFDFSGELWYVKGSLQEVASNSNSLYLQGAIKPYFDSKADGYMEFDGINSAGDVESYDTKVKSLDKITVLKTVKGEGTKVKFEVNKNFPDTETVNAGVTDKKIDKFVIGDKDGKKDTGTSGVKSDATIIALNKATEVIGTVVTPAAFAVDKAETPNNVIEVTKDDNGKIVGLVFNNLAAKLQSAIDETDKYANGYKLKDSTLVYDVSNASDFDDPDEDDVSVTTWGELKKNGVDISKDKALVYANDKDEVTCLVTYSNSIADDTKNMALLTAVSLDGTKVVRISALVNGVKKTYDVKASNDPGLRAGDLAILAVNAAGTIVTKIEDPNTSVTTTTRFIDGVVADNGVDVGNGKIKVNYVDADNAPQTRTFKLGTDAEVYKTKGKKLSDPSVEGGLRDVSVGDKVFLGLSSADGTFVDVIVIHN